MPPRPVAFIVVLFWLAANGWLIYREVWPNWRAGEPPPYTIDLTQELSKQTVGWEVLQKGARVGRALSGVERQPDRTYKLRSQFHFDKLRLLGIDIRRLVSAYHVTEDGELLGLSAEVVIEQSLGKHGILEHDFAMQGAVENGQLLPHFFYNKEKLALGEVRIPVAGRGGALNPLDPLNRVTGLSAGRRWRIALFDPLGSELSKALGPQFQEVLEAVQGMTIPTLEAEVRDDDLAWDGADVPCFKIEYRKPGEQELAAATWVRRRDGLVLQQFSRHELLELTLRREPVR